MQDLVLKMLQEGLTSAAVWQLLLLLFAIFVSIKLTNKIQNYVGYTWWHNHCPFEDGSALRHPTPTGSADAQVSQVTSNFVRLDYHKDQDGNRPQRFIPMCRIKTEVQSWCLLVPIIDDSE